MTLNQTNDLSHAKTRPLTEILGAGAATALFGLLDLEIHTESSGVAFRDFFVSQLATLGAYFAVGAAVALALQLHARVRPSAKELISMELGVAASTSCLFFLLARMGSQFSLRAVTVLLAALVLGFAGTRLPRAAATVLALTGAAATLLACLSLFRSERSIQPSARTSVEQPAVLLITVDTLRADFLGAYGRQEARTPVLDRLAKEGYRFTSATSQSNLTGPSHLTILTGTTPQTHGVVENGRAAPSDLETLSEAALRRGLSTAAFVSAAPLSQDMLGILDRFEHHDQDFRKFRRLPRQAYSSSLGRLVHRLMMRRGLQALSNQRPGEEVTDSAIDWLQQLPATRPFLLWAHYFDPHLPYDPPSRFLDDATREYKGPDLARWYDLNGIEREALVRNPGVAQQMTRLYDAEIAAADFEIGRLIQAAREQCGNRPLWIVVTADHGTSFGEHNIWNGRDVYQPSVHVPLIIRPPTALAEMREVQEPVGLVDVAPTIADLLDLELSPRVEGVPLLTESFLGSDQTLTRTMVAVPGSEALWTWKTLAVRKGHYKAIRRSEGWSRILQGIEWRDSREELYNLSLDPLELNDLSADQPLVLGSLLGELLELEAPVPTDAEIDPEQRRVLESLGYIN